MKVIHRTIWDCLEGSNIFKILDKEFEGVTSLPSRAVVKELQRLRIATLELYENRTGSTVYRIRQSGEIFQIESINGDTFIFDDAEEYASSHKFDTLIESYALADPKYTVQEIDGKVTVTRTKPPRFTARYVPGKLENIEICEWLDPVHAERIPKLLTAAGTVIARYLRNKNHE